MPIIKGAKKALRQTKKRTAQNSKKKSILKRQLTKFTKKPSAKEIDSLYSLIDKLAKRNIIHKNKAGRIKSRLAKIVPLKKIKEKSTP